MQKTKAKLKTGPSLGKLKTKVLRLLRADSEFQVQLTDQERIVSVPTPVDVSYDHREIENVLLSAEYEKAGALMELQRHRIIQ